MNVPQDIDSGDESSNAEFGEIPTVIERDGESGPFIGFPMLGEDFDSTGDTVDAEIVDEEPPPKTGGRARSRSGETGETPKPPRDAKTGPPSLDEWTSFLSRVVLRTMCDWYINWAFRGVDENALTDRELERLDLTDDEKKLIAVPFAELANKSKFMRKHGRMIVASGDAFNAFMVLGAWMSRVNRIAARHKPRPVNGKVVNNGRSGQGTQAPPGSPYEGTTGGRFPPGFNGGVIPGTG